MKRFGNRLQLAVVVLMLLSMVSNVAPAFAAQDNPPATEPVADTPAETPVVTPETPVVTPETPVTTPETPVVTPETPVVTPETPAVTPVTPETTPETPVVTPNAVVPMPPTIVDGNCIDGIHTPPLVTPVVTDGITYVVSEPSKTGEYTITATLLPGFAWGNTTGWTIDVDDGSKVSITVTPLDEPCAEPQARGASIMTTGDETSEFTIQKTVDPSTVAQNMNITYTIIVGWGPSIIDTPFVVTDSVPTPLTSIVGSCYAEVPDGAVGCSVSQSGSNLTWSISPNGYEGTVYLRVSAFVPAGTAGQTVTNYAYVQSGDREIVAANTFTILSTLPTQKTADTAAPIVGQGQCIGGTLTLPTLSFPDTTGVEYTVTVVENPSGPLMGPYQPGQIVTIRATTKPGYVWKDGSLTGGWQKVDSITATRTVTFSNVSCVSTNVVDPTLNQAQCNPSGLTTPSFTYANNDKFTYSTNISPSNGATVIVTATIKNGFQWGTLNGWVLSTDGRSATKSFIFNNVPCTEAIPAAPVVTPSECTPLGLTAPTYTQPTTTGITYGYVNSPNPPAAGGSVTITATLSSGYKWGSFSGTGFSQVGSTNKATRTITFTTPSCTTASPVTPSVAPSICTGGVVTAPSYSKPSTTGITYSYSNENLVSGGSVTVTATLSSGFKWGNTTNWSVVGNVATRVVNFPVVTCTPADLVDPDLVQAQCTSAGLTAPSFTYSNTTKFTYSTNIPPASGATVIVTATINNGFNWGDHDGWTLNVGGTSATKSFTFNTVPCSTVDPVAPTVTQAECTPGGLTLPSYSEPTTTGISYAYTSINLVAGGSVTVTASLQSGFSWGNTSGWAKAGESWVKVVRFAGVPCTPGQPTPPDVDQAECINGAVSTPSVTTPANTTKIHYVKSGDETPGGTVTIVATLQTGASWGPSVSGWTYDGDTATWSITLNDPDCTPAPNPVNPDLDPAECVNGALTQPSLTTTNTTAIHYTYNQAQVVNGGTVEVTATLQPGYAWGDLTGTGWVKDGAALARKSFTFILVECTSGAPATPQVTQAQCVNGALTPATLGGLADTAQITYDWDAGKVTNGGGAVLITATLADGNAWATNLNGWTKTGLKTATITVTFNSVACTPAPNPVNPDLSDSECVNGALTEPTLGTTNTSAIHYTYNQAQVVNGGTVEVTATLQQGFAWDDLTGTGWVKDGASKATKSFTFELVACTPVAPVNPVVEQAECTGGRITTPHVTKSADTAAIHYVQTGTVAVGETVTVVATLQPGSSWATPHNSDWTYTTSTATWTITLDDPECDTSSPTPLKYEQAQCVGGGVSTPILTFDNSKGIIYSYNQSDVVNGGSVTVTAILGDGLSWGDLGDWQRVNAYIATRVFTFEKIDCEPAMPVDPDLTQAECRNGNLSGPSVSFDSTEGIVYTYTGGLAPGSTIVVTATIQDGYEWGDNLGDWTRINATTATNEFTFDNVECTEVLPAAPNVFEAECIGGELTDPSVVLQQTAGIVYTKVGEEIAGGTVTVTATLQNGHSWASTDVDGWTFTTEKATYVVELDDTRCTPTSPVAPQFTESVCLNGALTIPTVTFASTTGVTYSKTGTEVSGGQITVIATLQDGYAWGNLGDWTIDPQDATRATLVVDFEPIECIDAPLATPAISNGECIGGAVTLPTVTVQDSAGITYDVGNIPANGGNVTITATLQAGYAWGNLTGWTIDEEDATSATRVVAVTVDPCDEISPVAPTVVQEACVDGQTTEPSVTLARTTGITYTRSGSGTPGGTVIVTAILVDGYGWPDSLPTGWTKVNASTATYRVDLAAIKCTEVAPVAPAVVEADCINGSLKAPAVTLASTIGITYSQSGNVVPGGTVVVTAELADGYGWPGTLSTGWTKVDTTRATYTIELDDVECEEVVPVSPVVVEASCINGGVTQPSVTLASTTGVTYSKEGAAVPGGTVMVTATLGNGHSWGPLSAGWTFVNPTTATYSVDLDDARCTHVAPVAPAIVEANCINGEVTVPTVTLATTNGITYARSGDVVPGSTVTVTATIEDGFAWQTTVLAGWTFVNATTATYTVELDDVECTPVAPVAPAVVEAECINGGVTVPTITLAATTGIAYSTSGAEVAGGTVIVTATVQDGYSWTSNLPSGWTKVNASTATYTVELADAECELGSPIDPIVTDTSCLDGKVVNPTITLPDGYGDIIYTMTGEVVPGGTVIVTATVQDGYAWETTTVAGWAFVNATTATYTVTIADPTCDTPVTPTPEVPETPTTPETSSTPETTGTPSVVKALPVTGNGPASNGLAVGWMLLAASLLMAAAASTLRRKES